MHEGPPALHKAAELGSVLAGLSPMSSPIYRGTVALSRAPACFDETSRTSPPVAELDLCSTDKMRGTENAPGVCVYLILLHLYAFIAKQATPTTSRPNKPRRRRFQELSSYFYIRMHRSKVASRVVRTRTLRTGCFVCVLRACSLGTAERGNRARPARDAGKVRLELGQVLADPAQLQRHVVQARRLLLLRLGS